MRHVVEVLRHKLLLLQPPQLLLMLKQSLLLHLPHLLEARGNHAHLSFSEELVVHELLVHQELRILVRWQLLLKLVEVVGGQLALVRVQLAK